MKKIFVAVLSIFMVGACLNAQTVQKQTAKPATTSKPVAVNKTKMPSATVATTKPTSTPAEKKPIIRRKHHHKKSKAKTK